MPNPRAWRYWIETASRLPQGTYTWRGVLHLPVPIQFHSDPWGAAVTRARAGYDETGPGAGGEIAVQRVTPLPPWPAARVPVRSAGRWWYLLLGVAVTPETPRRYVGMHWWPTPWRGTPEEQEEATRIITDAVRAQTPGAVVVGAKVVDVVALPPLPTG